MLSRGARKPLSRSTSERLLARVSRFLSSFFFSSPHFFPFSFPFLLAQQHFFLFRLGCLLAFPFLLAAFSARVFLASLPLFSLLSFAVVSSLRADPCSNAQLVLLRYCHFCRTFGARRRRNHWSGWHGKAPSGACTSGGGRTLDGAPIQPPNNKPTLPFSSTNNFFLLPACFAPPCAPFFFHFSLSSSLRTAAG